MLIEQLFDGRLTSLTARQELLSRLNRGIEYEKRYDVLSEHCKYLFQRAYEISSEKYDFEKSVKEDLVEYLQHDSWRCGYHQKCHCGLDDLMNKLKLEIIPLPNKGV
jgi:hypothetical protein